MRVLARRQQLPLTGVVAARLFDIDVLASLQRQQRRRRVPVIRCRDYQGVDIVVIEGTAEVTDSLRRTLLMVRYRGHGLLDRPRVDVAHVGDLGSGGLREGLRQQVAAAVDAHDGDVDALARRVLLVEGRNAPQRADADTRHGALLEKTAAAVADRPVGDHLCVGVWCSHSGLAQWVSGGSSRILMLRNQTSSP